ncbi:MAG: hypothetical protein Q7U02_07480 [Desulfosalsimonadaceae bacterium]|nr:hypothetical protein [Desulfosalsimonadaceae bacterium]
MTFVERESVQTKYALTNQLRALNYAKTVLLRSEMDIVLMIIICDECNEDLRYATVGRESYVVKKSKKAINAFHGAVLLLLCIGMLAGYYWIPLLGFLLEIAFWIYCLLVAKNEGG